MRALGASGAHVLLVPRPSCRILPLALARPQSLARYYPLIGASQDSTAPPSGRQWPLADGHSAPLPWQHRPDHSSSPAAPMSMPFSSTSSSGRADQAPIAATSSLATGRKIAAVLIHGRLGNHRSPPINRNPEHV